MDYILHPEKPKQVTGKLASNEGGSSQPKRVEARENVKAPGAIDTAEYSNEDVYYDSDGGVMPEKQ